MRHRCRKSFFTVKQYINDFHIFRELFLFFLCLLQNLDYVNFFSFQKKRKSKCAGKKCGIMYKNKNNSEPELIFKFTIDTGIVNQKVI